MVFVLDRNGRPLMPCSEKRSQLMLDRGRARMHKVYPFTIRVVDRKVADSVLQHGYGYSVNRADHTGREQERPKGAKHTQPTAPALYLPGLNPGVSRAFR